MNAMIAVADSDLSPSRWELAAETIAVKIRWFGLLLGYALVNLNAPADHRLALNAILTVGLVFTLLDTWFSWKGRIFLAGYPLVISVMEALFIGLLCYFDAGLDSYFRYYYILSLICCSIRHQSRVTYLTCALHCLGYGILFKALAGAANDYQPFLLMLVFFVMGDLGK